MRKTLCFSRYGLCQSYYDLRNSRDGEKIYKSVRNHSVTNARQTTESYDTEGSGGLCSKLSDPSVFRLPFMCISLSVSACVFLLFVSVLHEHSANS